MAKEKLIKSKARVKKFAEVFTPRWVVEDMVKTVGEERMFDPNTTVLEPSIGTGNFYIYILEERLKRIPAEHTEENLYKVLRSVDTLYGIEIQTDNLKECHDNLWAVCEAWFRKSGTYLTPNYTEYKEAVYTILKNRIRLGDFLKIVGEKDENGKSIKRKKPLSDEEVQSRIGEFFR